MSGELAMFQRTQAALFGLAGVERLQDGKIVRRRGPGGGSSFPFKVAPGSTSSNPRRLSITAGRIFLRGTKRSIAAANVDLPATAGTHYVYFDINLDTLGFGLSSTTNSTTEPTTDDTHYYWILGTATVDTVDTVLTLTGWTPWWVGGDIHLTMAA